MKTKFPQKQQAKLEFRSLAIGDVFVRCAAPHLPMVRVRVVTSLGPNACSHNGEPYTVQQDESVIHYPNAVLDMGEPA